LSSTLNKNRNKKQVGGGRWGSRVPRLVGNVFGDLFLISCWW